MPIKINVKSVILYLIYAAVTLCVNSAFGDIPLSLALCFSMLICGTNLIATSLIYALCSIVFLNPISLAICLIQAIFVGAIVFAYRKTARKISVEAYAYFALAVAPFIIFSPWNRVESLYFTDNEYAVRAVFAVGALLFYPISLKCVYACIYRVYRCKLQVYELVCISAVYTVFGIGLYRCVGEYAFICALYFLTLFLVRLDKSPSAAIIACVLSLPLSLCKLTFLPMTECVVLSILALIFCGYGNFAPSAVCASVTALYLFINGWFDTDATQIVLRALLLGVATLAVALPSDMRLKLIKERLTCKKILPEREIEQFKQQTGEKLYRLSEVFREIEKAFCEMDEHIDDSGAKKRLLSELKARSCQKCEKRKLCEGTLVYTGFAKLINAGCVKGKVTLIDLPGDITINCSSAGEVINNLNALLADYRRFMIECENAKSGRKLLADQAKGVAEVMKSCAIDVSKRTANYIELEKAIKKKLAERGVSCIELYIRGEENCELCATVLGKVNTAEVAAVISAAMGCKYILRDKMVFDSERSLLIFVKPPALDATFGVAYAVKDGGKVSGDTHSVIKINESSFLMALADGMGSGEYARKVSSTAISLIEAFYRAEMPDDTVLDTINKLISFSREERFACIDIAAIDLNSGRANFVKIGSPVAVIVREGEIRVLESQSLPLGILDNLKPSTCTEQLQKGDIVTFMSDGITSAFNSTPELYEFLLPLRPLNPQNLADKILAAALKRTLGKAVDDMTVVCARIY